MVLFPSSSFSIINEHLSALWSDYVHIEMFLAVKSANLFVFN